MTPIVSYALYPEKANGDLFGIRLSRDNSFYVSNEILNEYHEILSKLASADVADNIISVISNSPNTLFFDPRFRFYIINSDPDDNKFVDCAIISQAKYIVSDDHHFDEAKKNEFPKVDVVSLRKFAEILANATNH